MRHSQLAKVNHQQIVIQYQLLDRNTPQYHTNKPEPVLESANMILFQDSPIITDKRYVNRPDTVLIDKENKTAFVTDTAVSLTP